MSNVSLHADRLGSDNIVMFRVAHMATRTVSNLPTNTFVSLLKQTFIVRPSRPIACILAGMSSPRLCISTMIEMLFSLSHVKGHKYFPQNILESKKMVTHVKMSTNILLPTQQRLFFCIFNCQCEDSFMFGNK